VIEIEEISNPTPWKEQTFKNILSSRTLSFVIISGQNVIGFCIASKVADECHLQNISVTASLRKQGIGKYILDTLIKRCALYELQNIILEVRESNKGAQEFYRKNNFNPIGKRKDYYKLGEQRESAVLMSLILP